MHIIFDTITHSPQPFLKILTPSITLNWPIKAAHCEFSLFTQIALHLSTTYYNLIYLFPLFINPTRFRITASARGALLLIPHNTIFTCRDLSATAITLLPTEGLHEIEVLKVQNTESLKVFPSVYNFKVRAEVVYLES